MLRILVLAATCSFLFSSFYMALFLSLACPSLFSCTCPLWEGTCLVITACGSLVLLHLVTVTLPQKVWVSSEMRELKCWMSGCGSAPSCGAVQTMRPLKTLGKHSWSYLRTTYGKGPVIDPITVRFTLLSQQATQSPWYPLKLLKNLLMEFKFLLSLWSSLSYQSKKGHTMFFSEVHQS